MMLTRLIDTKTDRSIVHAMNTAAPTDPESIVSIQIEWAADECARLHIAAWLNKRTRDDHRFARFRARQIVTACLWGLAPVTMFAFLLHTSGGNFLSLMAGMTGFLAVFALFLILRGGRLTPRAALRLAVSVERMGGLIDMRGR